MPQTDPPVPTIAPVTYSSTFVYGRQHMNQNFTLTRARTLVLTATITDQVNGTALDITGGSFSLIARWEVGGDAAITLTSPSSGMTLSDPTEGEITITFSPSSTTALPTQSADLIFPYECTYTDTSSNVYPVLYGKITVKPNIV